MSSDGPRTTSESENTCVVCFKTVVFYSIGICDHPVCFECSTRMRVLCKQNECPICRGDQPKVVFTKEIEPYGALKAKTESSNLQDVKYGLYFCSPSIQKAYYSLLELTCQICDRNEKGWPFKNFNQLKDHMRRDHELFYCDLCIENLKIFFFERKCYTRSELATHRRKGDVDNTSHRGHPLCEFCETRYMDSDDLFRHLRRDHFYCHYCDADGKHQYYSTYIDLRQHYRDEHYLCEEGDCKIEEYTSVFRTNIDLKVPYMILSCLKLLHHRKTVLPQFRGDGLKLLHHRQSVLAQFRGDDLVDHLCKLKTNGPKSDSHFAAVHSKHLSRAANKQARTLEVEFNFGPRRNEMGGQRGGRRQLNTRNHMERERPVETDGAVGYDNYNMEPGGGYVPPPEPKLFVNPLRGADFPSLGTTGGDVQQAGGGNSRASVTFTSKFTPSFSGEEFPTLGGGAAPPRPAANTQKGKKSEDFPTLGQPRDVIMTKRTVTTSSGVVQRNNHYRTLDPRPVTATKSSSGGTSVKLTVNQERPQSSRPNVSIHVNHKSNGAVTTRISTAPAPPPTSTIQVRPKTMEAFPALGPSSGPPVMLPQKWVQPKQKKYVEPKAMKVAPAPILPPSDLSAFPTLSKKSELNKASSSTQMPFTWVNLNSLEKGGKPSKSSDNSRNVLKDKTKKKSEVRTSTVSKSEDKTVTVTKSEFKTSPVETNDNKLYEINNKNKKKKQKNAENQKSASIETNFNNNTKTNGDITNGQIVKKYSSLQIEMTEVNDPKTYDSNVDNFPALGNNPPAPPPGLSKKSQPPGIGVKPPPGFNFASSNANDLTFTNSAGQSYAILPTHTYYQPPNFTARNANLIQNFFDVLKTNEAMNEFKSYSDLFRNGGYPAVKYYEHCELVLNAEFPTIFPELMVLLPDIEKQQDLYKIHRIKGNVKGLDECATCKQVIFVRDLKQHLNNHYMENHFPSLGLGGETNNVWKK